jgi:hypothetical protein
MRPPRSWWDRLVSEGIFCDQLMRVGRALRRARLAVYKSDRRRRGGFLPLHLAFDIPASRASAPEPFLPLRFCSWGRSCLQFLVPPPVRMAPQQPITIIDPPAWERSTAASWRRMWRGSLRSGSCRRRGTEFPTPRTATSSASSASTSAASRRLRRLPGDPSELGSLGPPLPRGIAYAGHVGAEDSPRGARRRLGARGAELAQGGIHPQHDDLQQRGLGAGVVLPPQRRP